MSQARFKLITQAEACGLVLYLITCIRVCTGLSICLNTLLEMSHEGRSDERHLSNYCTFKEEDFPAICKDNFKK